VHRDPTVDHTDAHPTAIVSTNIDRHAPPPTTMIMILGIIIIILDMNNNCRQEVAEKN